MSSDVTMYVKLSEIQQTFQFCTPQSKAIGFTAATAMKYYVFPGNWIQLNDISMNILNSSVTTNAVTTTTSTNIPYSSNNLLIKHDFLRYVSKSLFNIPYGCGMIKNKQTLILNLNTKGGIESGVLRDISTSLWRCTATQVGTIATAVDASGSYYASNSNTTSQNICRYLVETLYANAPARFIDEANGVNESNKDYYSQVIPFLSGDIINFTVVVNPLSTQNQLTGVASIASKTYNVSLNIVADPYSLNPIPTL